MSHDQNQNEPPVARVETAGMGAYLPKAHWLVTLVCLAAAVGLFIWAQGADLTRITIRFQEGHGLKLGDELQHRGIAVGEVSAIALSDDFEGVEVEVVLERSAAGLAREGSLFWIERPQLSLGRMRGLETIVGAKYLGVFPGPTDAPPKYEFVGEQHPLSVEGTASAEIIVRFREGNGLVVGDPLRHRGIQVGEVVAVDLNADLSQVEVKVRLAGYASQLARAGSRFWVERPRISLSGVRGLETVVAGRYLSVLPGPAQAENLREFDGLDDPPPASSDGLEIVLESPHRFGVEAAAPVTYRGMQVGSITAVRLSPDSSQVETHVHVDADYRSLVCENTRFWITSGIDINVGLSGFELTAETLQTIAAGGVAFATPNEPGAPASTGHRFQLERNAEPNWTTWAPRLASGPNRLADGSVLPRPSPLALTWQVQQLAWKKRQQRNGLVLLLSDGSWLGPKNLFTPPPEALEGSGLLEFGGESHRFVLSKRQDLKSLATYRVDAVGVESVPTWSVDNIRVPESTEDCLIVISSSSRAIPLPSNRVALADTGDSWTIDASFTVPPQWHGASIVAVADGKLVAVLEVDTSRGNARALFVK